VKKRLKTKPENKKYGAAVIVMAFDEDGQAVTLSEK
jgi:cobalamin-dependent methionine synthase I